jgi:katanin p60 ATPase-containing subunit A1
MKTELLIQMDGLRGGKAGEQVFVMAASNLPWDLDMAVLRRYRHTLEFHVMFYMFTCSFIHRLEKRVMVPLPEVEAREAMIRQHLKGREVESLNYLEVRK